MSEPASRKALLLGATGLVGRHCLEFLLSDTARSDVRTVTRRALPDKHPKLTQHVVSDFDKLAEDAADHEHVFAVHDVYIAFGTTIRIAGSQDRFRAIDFGYPLELARACAAQGASHLAFVSSLGADPHARSFYLRVKGELEQELTALDFRTVTIIRPSIIRGERPESRPMERIGELAMRLAPRRFRSVDARLIAEAVVRLRPEDGNRVRVVESHELH